MSPRQDVATRFVVAVILAATTACRRAPDATGKQVQPPPAVSTGAWLPHPPEVRQTRIQDSGPAALVSLLRAFRISFDEAAVRSSWANEPDGPSIDQMEDTANRLGLRLE